MTHPVYSCSLVDPSLGDSLETKQAELEDWLDSVLDDWTLVTLEVETLDPRRRRTTSVTRDPISESIVLPSVTTDYKRTMARHRVSGGFAFYRTINNIHKEKFKQASFHVLRAGTTYYIIQSEILHAWFNVRVYSLELSFQLPTNLSLLVSEQLLIMWNSNNFVC